MQTTMKVLLCLIISGELVFQNIHAVSDVIPNEQTNSTHSRTTPLVRKVTIADDDNIPLKKSLMSDPNQGKPIQLSSCNLLVTNDSRDFFSQSILKRQYNFVYMKLHFDNQSDIAETKQVINKYDWVWTYEGDGGAKQYLYLPRGFGYLSFGLLWAHTCRSPMLINMKTTGDCSKLRIGTNETDKLIGQALGTMTSTITSQHMKYYNSFWCYNSRVPNNSNDLCKYSICTGQYFEYRCCRYVSFNLTHTIECNKEHYRLDTIWWLIPIAGYILFACYPILLMKIGVYMTEYSRKRKRTGVRMNLLCEDGNACKDNKIEKIIRGYEFVSLKEHFPISFTGTLLSPLLKRDCNGPVASRVLRLWLIICPIAIIAIHVYLDYKYIRDLIIGAVQKGAFVGFSSLIAGTEAAKHVFLPWFNGSKTAMAIFIIFSCALVVYPKRLDESLEKGLPEIKTRYVFLVKIPLKFRERFSGKKIRKYVGYKRLYQLFFAQIFMLLNWKFWRHAIRLFCARWQNVIYPVISQKTGNLIFALILSVILFPIYVIFSFIELVLTAIYFVIPVFSSFFIVLKALIIEYFALFQHGRMYLKLLRNVFLLPLIGLFLFIWYIYCIIFFDAFWFLSKMAIYTYSGIIAYPKLSYGYMVMWLMSLYYLTESVNAYGQMYRDLLKESIDVIEKVRAKYGNEHSMFDGIEFKDIIDEHIV